MFPRSSQLCFDCLVHESHVKVIDLALCDFLTPREVSVVDMSGGSTDTVLCS